MWQPERPTAEKLRELYHDQGLSLRAIGKQYMVVASVVLRWMEEAGIERRRPGLSSQCPECGELKRLYVDHGLSMEKVGEQYLATASAVRRWLQRCGITARRVGDYPNRTSRYRSFGYASDHGVPRAQISKKKD